ncbi:MbcA/ParS/Xre antitoxin family protein [Vibrio sp. 99-8-1]|uniref:MbcA/ParS/Xre antitoxin family protein n=1 Tax=Vibrio sp. 99-8-1 TaxID=2607602 RepID=UPI0014937BB6|nr:MbcA/ParS/Xre antitoxin family protein [Vibrio sp. 99-8-1]NOI66680.1 DUF2384 domain-containing protein [Vibrio sp. 99-8-1]
MAQVDMTTLDSIVLSRFEENYDIDSVPLLTEATLKEPRLAGQTLRIVVKTIPREVVAKTIDVSSSNLSKLYARKHLTIPQSQDISDLTAFWAEMRDVFMGDSELIDEWLNDALPSLDGRAPIELVQTLAGRKALREVLERLRYGDFS